MVDIALDSGLGEYHGKYTFDEFTERLNPERSATGIRLLLPTSIVMPWKSTSKPRPMLSNIRVRLSVEANQTEIDLGDARDDNFYLPAQGEHPLPGNLWWRVDFRTLALFEKIRDGKEPVLRVSLEAEYCQIVHAADWFNVRTEPKHVRGHGILKYRSEVWRSMLRNCGAAENIAVEVPVPGSPPTGWEAVWSALIDARNAFEQGGSTGWKSTVVNARLALERWQALEQADHGPGWTRPADNLLRARDKKQRLDNVRWHLIQFAHWGAHTGSEEWSRDDAILVIAALTSLLAERHG